MKTALILVDIQNDYFPKGKMELKGSDAAGLQARKLLDYFRGTHQPVVFIQHLSTRPGATFFLPGTPGAEIHPSIAPLEGEPIIEKRYPNSFRETTLLDYLREQQIDRLVICGMQTHMCIDTTVRAAFDLGFINLVAGDACATRDLAFEGQTVPAETIQAAFLAALQPTFCNLMRVEDLINLLKAEEQE